jgi:hypothetical protein
MSLKKKDWSVDNIANQLRMLARECSDYGNDGISSFEIKKDLWQIKFLLDDLIKSTPYFSMEEQWLTEQEKKRIIKILKS